MIEIKDLNKMYESIVKSSKRMMNEGFEQYTKDAYDAEIDRKLEREHEAEGKFDSIGEWFNEGPGKDMLEKMLTDGMKRILPASMEWTVDEWDESDLNKTQIMIPTVAFKLGEDGDNYAYVSVTEPNNNEWFVEDSKHEDVTEDLIAALPHGQEDLDKIIKLLIDVENISTEEFEQVKLED